MADIPVKSLVAALVPLFLGMLFANLDEKIRDMCSNAAPFLIPFNGWTLGAGMTWDAVLKAGVPGIILGLVTLISTGIGTYFIFNWVFRRKKRPLATGVAIGNTAGNAIPTPKFVAEADPSLESIVPAATAQIATSCVVTAILCPVLTTLSLIHIFQPYCVRGQNVSAGRFCICRYRRNYRRSLRRSGRILRKACR